MAERLETTSRPKYRSYAVVIGQTTFPIDMLRYDECRPFQEQDSRVIEDVTRFGGDMPKYVILERFHVDAKPRWTPGRWESFGWRMRLLRSREHALAVREGRAEFPRVDEV